MSNNYDNLFRSLDTLNDTSQDSKEELISFLRGEATKLRLHPERSIEIAYTITGLLATNFARALPENDPIDEILTIAGELEVNPENADELRDELIRKIGAL